MSDTIKCVVVTESGDFVEAQLDSNAKVQSLKTILGALPTLAFGVGDVKVVAFCGDQSKIEDHDPQMSELPALKDLELRGKVVFMKDEGDLSLNYFESAVVPHLKTVNTTEEKAEEKAASEEEEEEEEEEAEDSEVESDDMEESDFQSAAGEASEDDDDDSDEDEDEDDAEEDDIESRKMFDQIMSKTGPLVKAILIKTNGKTSEVELDMTPKSDPVSKALGGAATFIGQYKNGAVVMKLRNPGPNCKPNKAVLPPPFEKAQVLGKILIVKMDKDAEPLDFTIDDYIKLATVGDVEDSGDELSEKEAEELKKIARTIGSKHGEQIAEYYEKELESVSDTSSLRELARKIGKSHGEKIYQFLEEEKDAVTDTALLEEELPEETEAEDIDFDDDAESSASEDEEEQSTVEEKQLPKSSAKVGAILVRTDGTAEEHTVDVSQIATLIGGSPTILGDYENGVMVMKLYNTEGAKVNKVVLPAPLENEQVKGDIVLMKFDSEAEPLDFTLQEYETFVDQSVDDEEYVAAEDSDSSEDEEMEIEEDPVEPIEAESDESDDDESDDGEEEEEAQSAEIIQKMLSLKGPIVQAVLFSKDGKAKEVTLDMTPRLNTIVDTLGGPVTIVGQYDNGVVVLKCRESTDQVNPLELPCPFKFETIRGKALLVKMDEESTPQSFTLSELSAMKKAKVNPVNLIDFSVKARCVVVKVSGEVYQDSMTVEDVQDVVGGALSVVGQYSNGAVVLKLRSPKPSENKLNQCTLPKPFEDEQVLGTFVVMMLDKQLSEVDEKPATPVDFSIEDFVSLRMDADNDSESEDEDYEEEEDSSESEDEFTTDHQEELARAIIDKEFPTLPDDEKTQLIKNLVASFNGQPLEKTPSLQKSSSVKKRKRQSDAGKGSTKKQKGEKPEDGTLSFRSPGGTLRIQAAN